MTTETTAAAGRLSALDHLTDLNLGCGTDIHAESVNLDRSPLPGVDVVHDLARLPLPFPADRFSRIVCQDVLEHVDIVPTIRELHRILAPGGILEIRVPHFTCANTYGDPTHLRAFSVETFDYFCAGSSRGYYFDLAFPELQDRRISFTKGPSYLLSFLLEPLVNISPKMQVYYERSLLRIFLAVNIRVRLCK